MHTRPQPSSGDLMRLNAIARHLELREHWPSPGFEEAATLACRTHIAPILRSAAPETGEDVASVLAAHYRVHFEEVRAVTDIGALEDKYLRGQRELGFARLRDELRDPSVDALLFRRMNATDFDPDQWVAVLNLVESRAKAYWNRFHELTHRISEPAQLQLPFRRHRLQAANPVEALIDSIASELAFYPPLFEPLVRCEGQSRGLTIHAIEAVRMAYAPTASLLSCANAVVKHWFAPAILVIARIDGRRCNSAKDRALRVAPELAGTEDGIARLR